MYLLSPSFSYRKDSKHLRFLTPIIAVLSFVLLTAFEAQVVASICSDALTPDLWSQDIISDVGINYPKIRIKKAHSRLLLDRRQLGEGFPGVIAFVTVVSPEYDVPTFNLGNAELAGYLRDRNPLLVHSGIHFIEPDIVLEESKRSGSSVEYTISKLRELRPHIIGLSAKVGSTENLIKILDQLRNETWAEESILVVGNVVSTFAYEDLILHFPESLFVLGAGELSIQGIYQSLLDGSLNLEEIPNLVYSLDVDHKNSKKKILIKKTKQKQIIYAEQNWMPALDTIGSVVNRYGDIVIRATTGCSSNCTFCSVRNLNIREENKKKSNTRGWNPFPPERTAKLFKILQMNGINRLNLADDEFGNVDFGFLNKLADLLIHQENQISFNVSMRLDALWRPKRSGENEGSYSEEMTYRIQTLRKLKQAGLDSLFVGAESGSPTQLRRYGKGYPLEVNTESLKLALAEGFTVSVGFIPFDPLVTRREIKENLNFLEKLVANGIHILDLVASPINVMRIQRNTPYEHLLRKLNLLGELEPNFTEYTFNFRDPRMEAIATRAKQWFRDVISVRYPTLQMTRISRLNNRFPEGTSAQGAKLIRRMHLLDLQFIREMLNVFQVDQYDAFFDEDNSFKGRSEGVKEHSQEEFKVLAKKAREKWLIDVENQKFHLDSIMDTFRQQRSDIIKEMEVFLKSLQNINSNHL